MHQLRHITPFLLAFSIFLLLIFFLHQKLMAWGIDAWFLHAANLFLLLLSLLIYFIQSRSAKNKNPHVFVRAIMGGMMLKMFAVAAAVVIYALASASFNKYAVFTAMFIYLFYLIAEVIAAQRLNKKANG